MQNQTLRQNILRTTDLVQIFLTLDQEYYGGRHQAEQDRSDIDEDEDDPLADFFHDFATVSAIATSLQSDLQKLREISQQSQDNTVEGMLILQGWVTCRRSCVVGAFESRRGQ